MRSLALAAALAALLPAVPASAADLKFGYVDLQRALNEVEEGKAAKAALEKDFTPKRSALEKEEAELKKTDAELQKQAAVLSDDAKREKGMEFQKRVMDYQERVMAFQKELAERQGGATRPIIDRLTALVREIANDEGVGMVFERNASGLIVAPPSLDLTNELIRKYNAKFKAASAEKKAEKGEKKKADKKADAKPKAAEGK